MKYITCTIMKATFAISVCQEVCNSSFSCRKAIAWDIIYICEQRGYMYLWLSTKQKVWCGEWSYNELFLKMIRFHVLREKKIPKLLLKDI